jgi:hypothetical protein
MFDDTLSLLLLEAAVAHIAWTVLFAPVEPPLVGA